MERALRWVQFQFSGSPQKRGFGCACVLCLPRPERFRQPGAWAHSPRCGCGASFPAAAHLFPPRRIFSRRGASFPSAAHHFPSRPQRTTGRVPAACVCSEELPLAETLLVAILRNSFFFFFFTFSSFFFFFICGGFCHTLKWTGGLSAVWEGVASLGLSLPLSPPPASSLQRGWAGSSLEFLSPFVLRTAGGAFRPVNFLPCSPTV